MKSRRLLAATLSAATLLGGLQIMRVEAQGNGRFQGNGQFQGNRGNARFQQQQRGNFQANRNQPSAVNGAIAARMRRLNASDPTRSAVNYLLTRNDVRSELYITTRQREALDAANQKAPQEMMDRLRNSQELQEMTQRMRRLRDVPPGERQAQREQMRQEMQQSSEQLLSEIQNYQSDLDKRTLEILTPEQVKRLHELDLQYRHGLALADGKRAQELALTQEQYQKVQEYLEEYRNKQRELTSEAMGYGERTLRPNGQATPNGPVNQNGPEGQPGVQNNNGTGNAPDRIGGARGRQNAGGASQYNTAQAARSVQIPNPQELQTRLNHAQTELDRLRKTLGAKALALLNHEQAAYWKSLTGRAFTFRVVD